MKAKNTNLQEMEKALEIINQKYDNNIRWKRFENKKTINFTLTVINSKEKGSKINRKGRRISAACWHVHGDFFDALFSINPNAVIISLGKTITNEKGNWENFNIGTAINPFYISDACNC